MIVEIKALCLYARNLNDSYYCTWCDFCSDCFACEWLKHKKYCIFNKQYTKEEYEQLVPKIIEHMQKTWEWWQFFPINNSPYPYNKSLAQEYYQLNKENIVKIRWSWSDDEVDFPKVSKIINAQMLPDTIDKIPDDVLNWAIKCEVSWVPFMIIPQELEFYRKYNIPLPHLHPDERHKVRMKERNDKALHGRHCNKCNKDIQTSYSPDSPEVVYCEECYLKEIY